MKLKWENVKQEIFYNPHLRIVFNTLYRNIFLAEKKEVNNFYEQNKKDNLLSICLPHVHFMEHIKDLIDYLKISSLMKYFLVGPTWLPQTDRKRELFSFYKNKYNIAYSKNIFAYPWLKILKPKVFLELGILLYSYEIDCTKILYAHGMAGLNFGKDYGLIKYINQYNAIFLNGPLHKKALLVAQKMYNIKLPRLYEIGFLRGDRLCALSSSFNHKAYLTELNLPHTQTVLFAPTWGEFSAVEGWIDKIVNVCRDLTINLLVRLHPSMLLEKSKWQTGRINWEIKLKKIKREYKQIIIVSNHDLDKSMLLADVLITDVSSMGLEFMAIDKPVVFIPAARYFQIYGEQRPEKWCRPQYEIKNKKDLKQKLLQAMNGKGYKYPIDNLIYNRGKSLQIMLNVLKEVMK